MTYTESQLGLGLLGVIVGFTILIFFLLKLRKKQMDLDLQLKAEEVWSSFKNQILESTLAQKDMLFYAAKDRSMSTVSLVVKDHESSVLAEVVCPMGVRVRTFALGDEQYSIEYPLTWKRTAVLKRDRDQQELAFYRQTGWFGRHEIEIPGIGILKSQRAEWTGRMLLNYYLQHKQVGAAQKISKLREIGYVAAILRDIPQEVRIFILVAP